LLDELSTSLGDDWSQPNYFKNNFWGTSPFLSKTSINLAKFQNNKKFRNPIVVRNENGNYKNVSGTGNRTRFAVTKLSIKNIPGEKGGRGQSAGIQSQEAERIFKSRPFLPNISLRHPEFSSVRRLASEDRFESGLFSCEHCKFSSPVSKVDFSRSNLPNDVFAVRSGLCSQVVCHINQFHRREATAKRNPYHRLFGRFSHRQSESNCPAVPIILRYRFPTIPRLDVEFQEVRTDTLQRPRISWSKLEYGTEQKVFTRSKDCQNNVGNSKTVEPRRSLSQVGKVPPGEVKFRELCNSVGSVTLPQASNIKSRASAVKSLLSPMSTDAGSSRSAMVAHEPKETVGNSSTTCYQLPDHRRSRLRLGSAAKRHGFIRDMELRAESLALQHEGVARHLRGASSEPVCLTKFYSTNSVGQSDSPGLPEERRRHQIDRTAGRVPKDFAIYRRHSIETCNPTSTGYAKYSRRSIIPGQTSPGVASVVSGLSENISGLWHATHRSICLAQRARSAEICEPKSIRPPSSILQCVQPPVALQTGLGVSTTVVDAAGSSTFKPVPRKIHCDNSQVGTDLLEKRLTSTSPLLSDRDCEPAPSLGRYDHPTPTTEPGGVGTGSVASWGWESLLTSWTNEERSLLKSSWRKSTLSSYRPAWNRWVKWCTEKNISINTPKAVDLARFLSNLSTKEGLAYSTIALHKSVISTFCEPYINKKLSEDVVVKHVLKAVALRKPRNPKAPIWNPGQVVNWLKDNVSDVNNLYQVSRRCATLLLLASGRRVHDLTLLNIDSGNMMNEGSEIVFNPIFGSKTDSAVYRQSAWKLLDHPDYRISPVFWIRQLLSLSSSRRGSIPALFITCRGEMKAASRMMISLWVKSILHEAGIDSPAGSTRSAVSSSNWINNFQIDEILLRGNWRSENTFHKFYRRQLINNKANDSANDTSVARLFQPI
jgi:site-specific recombinase XerD